MTIPKHHIALYHPRRFDLIIENLKLEPFLNWILINNPSCEAPYHGMRHVRYVVCDAYAILEHEDSEDMKPYSQNARRLMVVLAGLFHDCGHTLGMQSDKENINIALECFRQAYKEVHLPLTDSMRELIENAIICTEYEGGKFVREPASFLDKILRDADVFLPFHLNEEGGQDLLLGLYHEIVAEGFQYEKWAPYLEGQIKFMASLQYFTQYGKWMRDTWMTFAIERLRKMQQNRACNWSQINFHFQARHLEKWQQIKNNVQKLVSRK